jgi:hypothetical protein
MMRELHRIRGTRSWRRTLTIPAVAALLAGFAAFAGFGGAAARAAGASPVVGPGGTVAGQGYPQWLGAAEQVFFADGGSPPLCQTLHAHGGAVEFLDGADTDRSITCGAAAEEPIYVHGISNERSTVHGDHAGFGTSASQLQQCARKGFKGLHGTASIDGVPVVNYGELISAAPVVDALLPKHNAFHLPQQRLRSAGYGEGLLLRGLTAGRHTIVVKSITPDGSQQRKFVVHVS